MVRGWNPRGPFLLRYERGGALFIFLRTFGKDFEHEILVPQPHMERTIEPFLEQHKIIPTNQTRLDFPELEPLVLETDREIVTDLSLFLHREDGVQMHLLGLRKRTVRIAFINRDDAELRIERGNENIFQKYIRFPDGRYPREPELLHEPVLKRPEKPLNPAFRLRAVRGDEIDIQLFHHPLELGHELVVVLRVLVVHLVRAVLVEVNGDWFSLQNCELRNSFF